MRVGGIIGLLVTGSVALGAGAAESQPVTNPHGAVAQRVSLPAQARLLYAPVGVFERSVSRALRARINSAKTNDGHRLDRCQAPYINRLLTQRSLQKVYDLYENAALMEQYQSAVTPVSRQLTMLADAWTLLHLPNRPMNDFVHALASEFDASLTLPHQDACAFIKSIAAHNFSYEWARRSPAGKLAQRWWTTMRTARADAFWRFVGASGVPGTPAPGAKLFTRHQLSVLANLPGEIG